MICITFIVICFLTQMILTIICIRNVNQHIQKLKDEIRMQKPLIDKDFRIK